MSAARPSDEQLQKWGASLREIDPSALQPDEDEDGGAVRWFLGDGGTEIFAWSKEAAPPHHVQLVFARVSVEWSTRDGLKTGAFAGGSSTAGGRYDPYLLTVGARADAEVCRAALVLINSSPIDQLVKAAIQKALEESLPTPAAAP